MSQPTNGIPPVSDYAHWNEDAERVWWEENRYDMEHPPEPDPDDWHDGFVSVHDAEGGYCGDCQADLAEGEEHGPDCLAGVD